MNSNNLILEESPCSRLKKLDEQPRERVLSDAELAAFWNGLNDTGIDPRTALALHLILITGQRPGEVVSMVWSEIDGDWWTIPAMKAKNGREHRVPLTGLALELLQAAKKYSGKSAYVIPSPRPNGKDKPIEVRSLSRAVDRKHEKLGLEKFVPHDLRRTVRIRLAELGILAILNPFMPGMSLKNPQRRDFNLRWANVAAARGRWCGRHDVSERRVMAGRKAGSEGLRSIRIKNVWKIKD